MVNVPERIRELQKKCVIRCLPKGWKFEQVLYNDNHGDALQRCVDGNKSDITIFMDIDCIPLTPDAFRILGDEKLIIEKESLAGCAQRANHIQNNKHIYVGPFCMAFRTQTYKDLGSPEFKETAKGDVGEEITYRWQEKNKSLYFLWPSDVQIPMWNLFENWVHFGLGTTYEGLFYHAFNIRTSQGQELFTTKCNRLLGSKVLVGV
jgi:hypothetical protein